MSQVSERIGLGQADGSLSPQTLQSRVVVCSLLSRNVSIIDSSFSSTQADMPIKVAGDLKEKLV